MRYEEWIRYEKERVKKKSKKGKMLVKKKKGKKGAFLFKR